MLVQRLIDQHPEWRKFPEESSKEYAERMIKACRTIAPSLAALFGDEDADESPRSLAIERARDAVAQRMQDLLAGREWEFGQPGKPGQLRGEDDGQ